MDDVGAVSSLIALPRCRSRRLTGAFLLSARRGSHGKRRSTNGVGAFFSPDRLFCFAVSLCRECRGCARNFRDIRDIFRCSAGDISRLFFCVCSPVIRFGEWPIPARRCGNSSRSGKQFPVFSIECPVYCRETGYVTARQLDDAGAAYPARACHPSAGYGRISFDCAGEAQPVSALSTNSPAPFLLPASSCFPTMYFCLPVG